MPRFYVPEPRLEGNTLRIEGREVRHLRRVLRLRRGDAIVVFDDTGREYEGTIVFEDPTSVIVEITNVLHGSKDPTLTIVLAQGLLKGEKMDYIIQKATELGVSGVAPFFSSRSVPLLDLSAKHTRARRWERIAIEASKQSGRTIVPKIEPLRDYTEVLDRASLSAVLLIFWEQGGRALKQIVSGSKQDGEIFFVVGPEGGFNAEEVDAAKRRGFVPVSLGKRILRAETASLCFLSILQYEWGDLGSSE